MRRDNVELASGTVLLQLRAWALTCFFYFTRSFLPTFRNNQAHAEKPSWEKSWNCMEFATA